MAQTPAESAEPFVPHTEKFLDGLREAAHLIITANPVIVDTTLRTLALALTATAIGALVGVPCGCLLGLGRSRGSRTLLWATGAATRVPPVAVGVLVLVLVTPLSPVGGGPLADLHWFDRRPAGYLAQTLLAVPIITTLTAAAVTGVPAVLLDQARAFGAPPWRRRVLALREARRRVLAGVIAAMGITITSIGALVIAEGGGATLALSALSAFREEQPEVRAQTAGLTVPTQSLGVAYATILMGLFVLLAALLTWLQQRRPSPVAGIVS